MGRYPDFDQKLMGWVNQIKAQSRSGVHVPYEFVSLDHLLHDMRLYKSRAEISLMKKAARVSVAAHKRAMKLCKPGLHEYAIEAEFNHEFRRNNAQHAYPPIVVGGENGCILHYNDNNAQLNDGDLLLIDAGCEIEGYASDITRTFPVNGRFSEPQRLLYQLVLDAQEAAIAKVRPGNHWNDPHHAAVRTITRGLIELKLLKGNPDLMKDPTLKRWRELFNSGPAGAQEAYTEMNRASTEGTTPEALNDPKLLRTIWDKFIETGDRFNEPGRFTALLGYEYTSNYKSNNLHRVVIYRDSGERARQLLPFSALDSENPEDLWKSLQAYETETGGQVLAIPHNGNMSGGMMFAMSTFAGKRLTESWAKERARWEPVYEITQMKGDGEAHPMLSPNDEFADYETWDKMTIGGLPNSPENYPFEYARSALKNGLALEAKLGTNPFKFGFIGSTDSHTALAAVEEDNFFGKHSGVEPSAERMMHPVAKVRDQIVVGWEMSASGYAGVWATENTREALWDALKRKEVYATTGPRIIVRFFGGWDFVEQDAHTRRPAQAGAGAEEAAAVRHRDQPGWQDGVVQGRLDRARQRRPRLRRVGDGHCALRLVRQHGVHQCQGARKLWPALPHHVPQPLPGSLWRCQQRRLQTLLRRPHVPGREGPQHAGGGRTRTAAPLGH